MHSAHLRLIIISKLVCVSFVHQTVQRYHLFEYVPIWQIQLLKWLEAPCLIIVE